MLRESLLAFGAVYENEPMKKHTSFQIGGNAKLVVVPHTLSDIPVVLRLLRDSGERGILLGNGSNVLFPDEGIDAVIVKLACREMTVTGREMTISAGMPLTACAMEAKKRFLSGLAFAYGIPGTVGGGVYMNAGAYGGELSQVVKETTYCTMDGEIHTITGDAHQFGYRTSFFKSHKDLCILSCVLSLSEGDKDAIQAEMDDYMSRRREKQPLEYPSAGSVFKRPAGTFAGKLIEDCGLKGYRIGGAEVSTKHAGFIVNRGGATCDDVKKLISHIQSTVYTAYGITLECEIEMIS